MNTKVVLISSAVVFKKVGKKDLWFLVKSSEGEWEIPRTVVRKGESSVRASLRMMGEQGGMTTRVLEEAGRAGGVTTINDKTLPQRHLYYLTRLLEEEGEAIGFEEFVWLEYAKAIRKLPSKRERSMLKQARKELRIWRKKKKQEKQAKLAKAKQSSS